MTKTALILGGTGRFGGAMASALWNAGWSIRLFDRRADRLEKAAGDADVIVNGWNPPYDRWTKELVPLTQRVIGAARSSGARVVFPGNNYVYGEGSETLLTNETPHRAKNPLGKLRREIENMYRSADVPLLILRAGDYIDTEMSGNWFDRIITKPLARRRIDYPGDPEVPHVWAFLPDLARAGAALLETDLAHQQEVLFPGYTLSGNDLAAAIGNACGRDISLRQMPWWPFRLAAPFVPVIKGLVEMRYLWYMPHQVTREGFDTLLPGFKETPVAQALAQTAPLRALATSGRPRSGHDATPPTPSNRVQAT